jgi:hypothetical protein
MLVCALLRPVACVRWVGHGVGRLDARGGCSCAGWGALVRRLRPQHAPGSVLHASHDPLIRQ